jgi:hypothetical protein
VLICSNTNKAVDQVLYELCEGLGPEHRAMQEGKIVRLGRVADDKLQKKYREFVTIDGIVERRSADLKAEKQRLEDRIERLDAATRNARRDLVEFEALDRAEQLVAAQMEQVNQLARDGYAAKEEMARNALRANELAVELAGRKAAFFKFRYRREGNRSHPRRSGGQLGGDSGQG